MIATPFTFTFGLFVGGFYFYSFRTRPPLLPTFLQIYYKNKINEGRLDMIDWCGDDSKRDRCLYIKCVLTTNQLRRGEVIPNNFAALARCGKTQCCPLTIEISTCASIETLWQPSLVNKKGSVRNVWRRRRSSNREDALKTPVLTCPLSVLHAANRQSKLAGFSRPRVEFSRWCTTWQYSL